MLTDPSIRPEPPAAMKSVSDMLAHQARLFTSRHEAESLLLSFSVGLFSAADWQETTFLVRQIDAEIDLLDWVLGLRPTTWLDDLE